MFNLSACEVERMADGDYRLRWDGPPAGQRIRIYMTEDPDRYYRSEDPGTPLLVTGQREVILHNPDLSVRHYFYLQSECGEGAILGERQLPLAGVPNFRDLGGYEGDQGRKLKWGKLFRSSKLSNLTEEDQRYVKRLGLTLICDFRQVVEQELEPTHLGEDGTHLLASLPVTPGSTGNFIENLHNGIIAVDDASGFMQGINRDFVASQMPRYAEMFQLLLAGDQQLLIHCASGKDRTGFGSALILDVLGVDEDAIVEDYLLTNRYLPVEQEVQRLAGHFTDETGASVSEEVLRSMMEVRPEYIQACFEEIGRRFQSREHFYQSALALDEDKIAHLKDRYLE